MSFPFIFQLKVHLVQVHVFQLIGKSINQFDASLIQNYYIVSAFLVCVLFSSCRKWEEDLCVLTGDKMSELTSLTSPELALNQWPPETIL